jgi:hypothetical protein
VVVARADRTDREPVTIQGIECSDIRILQYEDGQELSGEEGMRE